MKLTAITRYRQEGDNYHVYYELFMPNKGGVIHMSVPAVNEKFAYFEITKLEFAELDRKEGVMLTIIPRNPKYIPSDGHPLDITDVVYEFTLAYHYFLKRYAKKNEPFPFILQKPNIAIDDK